MSAINDISKFLSNAGLKNQIMEAGDFFQEILIGKFETFCWNNTGKDKAKPKTGKVKEVHQKNLKDKYQINYGKQVDKALPRLHKVYLNAIVQENAGEKIGYDLKILGCEALRDNHIAKTEHHNFEIFNDEDNCNGSILNVKKGWNLLINDVAMLGAIHACKEFAIWSMRSSPLQHGKAEEEDNPSIVPMVTNDGDPTIDDDILWDAEEKRPRVTGRELLMLKEAGYELAKHDHEKTIGIYFINKDSKKASELTLKKTCEATKNATLQDLRKFLGR